MIMIIRENLADSCPVLFRDIPDSSWRRISPSSQKSGPSPNQRLLNMQTISPQQAIWFSQVVSTFVLASQVW
jgi:hypothetical protein